MKRPEAWHDAYSAIYGNLGCIRLTVESVAKISWLPPTCGYRLIRDGHDLYWWHPLVSGSSETVHQAGISMRGRVTALETDMADDEDYFDHVLDEQP